MVARLAALLKIDPADINGAIDGNPGSRFDLVRVATDVPEATARLIAEAGDALPGVEVVDRGAAPVSRGPARLPAPRLHGPGLGRTSSPT